MKNSDHFIQLLKSINLQRFDTLISFDVVSLFTNIPVDEALTVIRDMLQNNHTLVERSALQFEPIMNLLEVCLRTIYFQVNDKFFQQKDSMAMGSSLSPVVSKIFMEHFEKLALDMVQYKSSLWFRYVDDTFVVWPHGLDRLQNFFNHLNSLRTSIHFTMEIKSDSKLPFLDVLVIRKGLTLTTKVYRKPTHTGHYLNFKLNHPLYDKSAFKCFKMQRIIKKKVVYSVLTYIHEVTSSNLDRDTDYPD
jgi:hypothetical protein